jgi:hypothetical protein
VMLAFDPISVRQEAIKAPEQQCQSLENWENEGGAPASDNRTTSPRPKPDHEGPSTKGSQAKIEEVLVR